MGETVSRTIEERLTSERLVAYLATCYNGRPHVAPLWFLYEDETIEILTTGQKLANIKRNPKVTLAIQKDEDGLPEWRVLLRGHARIIEDDEVTRERNSKLNRKYGVDKNAWEENTLVRIDIGSASMSEY